jgi:hypothetical protein
MSSGTQTTTTQISGRTYLSIAVLTVLFVGVYFVLRSLPDAQCGFLHYEEIVNADGSVEFCATNHAGFLDLTRLKYPVEMDVSHGQSVAVGSPIQVSMELASAKGNPIFPYELAVTHTKKMHVMVVDSSLTDYHHVHPEPDGLSGLYTFEFTPKRAGTYQIFAELVPLRTRRQIIATGEIAVSGEPTEMSFVRQTQSVVGGLRFDLGDVPEHLRTGADYRFDLEVTADTGEPIVLEEIMGAKGHMVAFDAARKGFVHMHPVDSVVSSRAGLLVAQDSRQELAFLFNVPNSGWYRFFAQVQVDGREVFGHFDLEVE